MRSKKGFTLIELLAVIVILAIIALIATPIVLNIIKDSKDSSTLRSANFYLDAVEQTIARENDTTGTLKNTKCFIEEKGVLACQGYEKKLEIEMNGEKPSSGKVVIKDNKIDEIELYYEDKLVVKDEDNKLIYSEETFETVKDSNPGIICGETDTEDLNQETCYIKSIEDLVELSTLVNKGATFENKKVELVHNLDFESSRSYASKRVDKNLITGEGFKPIGNSTSRSFKGTFEGNNKIIKDLYINRPETSYVGLFGVTTTALIRNLNFNDCSVTAKSILGCLCGQLSSNTIVENVNSENVKTDGETGVGGLVGYCISSNVSKVESGNVIVDSLGANTGGLYSYAKECVTNKFILNNILVKSKNNHVGGLIGGNQGGKIYNGKMNKIVVEATSGNVGGVIGTNMYAELKNIKINANLSVNGYNIGLVVGNNSGNVTNIAVSGNYDGGSGGAFIGSNGGTADNFISVSGVFISGNIKGTQRLISGSSNANLNLLFSKDILFNNKQLVSDDPTSLNGKSLDDMGIASKTEYEALGFEFESTDENEAYWYFNEDDELDLFIKQSK